MVDVLCCALGCMILMWLNSAHDGEENSNKLLAATTDLDKVRADEARWRRELASSRAEEKRLSAMLASLGADQKSAAKTISELEAKYNALNKLKLELDKRLALRQKELEDLEKRLGVVLKQNTSLEESVRNRTAESASSKKKADDLSRRADDLAKKLKAAEDSIRELELTAKDLPKLKDELKTSQTKLDAEERLARTTKAELEKRKKELDDASKRYEALLLARRTLERQLDSKTKDLASALLYKERLEESEKKRQVLESESARVVERLEGEKKKLRDEAMRVRAAAEHRFAGIALTGKKVIFLVDTSGSMELVDEKTEAPTKWGDVRSTVARVMRSLPDLEKFQVITFAEEYQFLLGKPGQWLTYDAKTSADQVTAALAKIKPKGGTNMTNPMRTAFDYRALGLDTIYLFSDGLPNEGEGLTPEQARIKDETQRSNLLGKYIRRKLQTEWNRRQRGKERVRINAVGFFYESPDVGAFLWALARENDGSFVGMSKP
jgi:hypothetical protein